jgi:flagellin
MLFVNTNSSSLNAQRQLLNSGNMLDTAFKRLSSGFRINSAADDAAGLQISNRLTSQINGLDQAVRNSNDGISIAQVAEGSMSEITNNLQRMRTLIVQSENGLNSDEDKEAIQKEIGQLRTEIARIAETTEFGGIKLLDGSAGSTSFLVGANAGQTIEVDLSNDLSDTGLSIDGIDVTTGTTADNLDAIDAALKSVDGFRADLGAVTNRFQSTIRNLTNISENVSQARGRIQDTDFAKETANLTKAQILQSVATTILSQANMRPQAVLQLLG